MVSQLETYIHNNTIMYINKEWLLRSYKVIQWQGDGTSGNMSRSSLSLAVTRAGLLASTGDWNNLLVPSPHHCRAVVHVLHEVVLTDAIILAPPEDGNLVEHRSTGVPVWTVQAGLTALSSTYVLGNPVGIVGAVVLPGAVRVEQISVSRLL